MRTLEATSDEVTDTIRHDRRRPWARWLDRGGLRTRILVWYLVLLTLSIVIAIVGLRQILVTRLTADIDASLAQDDRDRRRRAPTSSASRSSRSARRPPSRSPPRPRRRHP